MSVEKFKENGYIVVPKILSGDLLGFVGRYACNRIKVERQYDNQVPNTPSFYKDYVMENLLAFLKPKVEEITGLKLFPTYTYFRVYKHGDELKEHKDRPSCEISMSLCLKKLENEKIWPLHANNEDYKKAHNLSGGSTVAACLREGDALIYRGCEISHWREPYAEGTKLAQAFLHYVDADGPHKEWEYDKKPSESQFLLDK